MTNLLILNCLTALGLAYAARQERKKDNKRDSRVLSFCANLALSASAATGAYVYLYGW